MSQTSPTAEYRRHVGRKLLVMTLAGLLLPGCFFYAMCVGPVDISASAVAKILLGMDVPENHVRIIYHSRLPQALAAMLADERLYALSARVLWRNPCQSAFFNAFRLCEC